jgi:hypothetical protein
VDYAYALLYFASTRDITQFDNNIETNKRYQEDHESSPHSIMREITTHSTTSDDDDNVNTVQGVTADTKHQNHEDSSQPIEKETLVWENIVKEQFHWKEALNLWLETFPSDDNTRQQYHTNLQTV